MNEQESGLFDDYGTYYTISAATSHPTPVVFLHGVGLDCTMWSSQVHGLSPYFPVLTYDLIGHGRTPHRPDTNSLADYVSQLIGLLDSLDIEVIHLVGFSVGGIIAQRFCGLAPQRLASVTFMNSVYQRTENELVQVRARLQVTRTQGALATADDALARWFNTSFRESNPKLMERIRTRLVSNDLAGYVAAYRCFVDGDEEVGDALKQIECPALAMTADGDVGSTPLMCERMAKDLRHPTIKIIEGFKHGAPIEAAAQVNTALLDFLTSNNKTTIDVTAKPVPC